MGVFAIEPIQKGEIIEICYYAVVVKPTKISNDIILRKYLFGVKKGGAIVWGYGSIYNHSFGPNIKFVDSSKDFIVFSAIENIEIGEELTHCYTNDKNHFEKWYLDKN